jgi:hypothetical protein
VQVGGTSYALDVITAEGQVRARRGDRARVVTLEADVVHARASTGRGFARGRPARLATDDGWLEAPELTLARSGDVSAAGGQPIARLEALGGDVRFAFTPPLARAAAPTPWTGRATRVVARVRLPSRADPDSPPPGTAPLARLERLDVAGPLTLAREDGSSRVDARRLAWDATGRRARLELEGEPVVAHLGADVTGEAPWRARARSLRAWLEPDAFTSRSHAAKDDAQDDDARPSDGAAQAVASAVLEGDVDLARQGDDGPRRHVALRGQRLVWSRHRERAELTGPAAAVTVGEGTLRGSALTFDVARGRLQAAGPCVLEVPLAGREGRAPATISIEAARADASIDPRPGAWREASAARRAARRAGAGLVIPGWLRALTLEGDGARRVRASGPDGLSAEGDRFTWDAAHGWFRLEAAAGGPPVRAATQGLALDAARLEVKPHRGPGRTRALVVARGGVRLRGSLPGGAEPLTLTSDWLTAEVWEPVRASDREAEARLEDALAPFGRVLAGGPDGVALDGALVDTSTGPGAGGAIPLRARASRLEADGTRETLRLDGWPDRPLLLARGDLQLEAPAARLALEDRRAALRVGLDGPWTCTLPAAQEGEAGRVACAGPLDLLLDVARARVAGDADTHDPAALARLVRGLDARGGLDVTTRDLRARADRATLGRPGELVLHGDPVEVTRGGMRSRGREQVLRLEELAGERR